MARSRERRLVFRVLGTVWGALAAAGGLSLSGWLWQYTNLMGSRDVADDFFGAIPVVLPCGLGLAVAIVAWANWGPRAGSPQPPEEPAAVLAASVRRVVRTRTSRTSRLGRVVRLLPLDARTSLAGVHWRSPEAGERWAPVARAVAADPDGPLARALSSPLILVLALSAYERRDPAELLDRRRFPGVDEVTWRVLENADPTANFELWRDDDRRGRRSEDRRHWPEVVTRVLGSADDALLLWWRMAATHAPRWLVPGVRLPLIVLTVPAVRAAGPDGPAFGALVGCALAQLFTVLSEDGAPRQVGGWAAERRGRRRRVRWALGVRPGSPPRPRRSPCRAPAVPMGPRWRFWGTPASCPWTGSPPPAPSSPRNPTRRGPP
ncbi:hypothetical protein OG889_16605 [Streptomyces sp. NBC_00481]|uniref:hypothetical protein n=1 Tax=Streptomyces sp. NBC_00481 TaxID=2975755 RepID=UPI002DDBC9F6|nr:hypothetical protein [Streptomyces sp. NBC_00481]WRY96214.1 hypothetical protein OG889_16605 [Streptomyces sp. NBC_00481]